MNTLLNPNAFAAPLTSPHLPRVASLLPAVLLAAALLAGCTAPISSQRVSNRAAYAQVEANALRTGKPSSSTVALLHRYDLDQLAEKHPEEAVRQLHIKAVATGERGLLFALAEMSYVTGDRIQRSLKPWDPRDARDFYLGSAVYSWLFLFGEGKDACPSAFDRRFRLACDLYNQGLGLGLLERKSTNGLVQLDSGVRRLPMGEIQLELASSQTRAQLGNFEKILLADQYLVHGLSVRNRDPGVGTPLICVKPLDRQFQMHPAAPATVLLRGPGSLAALGSGRPTCALELYSPFSEASTKIGEAQVPIETDLTAFRAYTLSQSRIWNFGKLDFLAPSEHIPSQLMLNQPFNPDLIPVVYVHGTFSSPVTWAEMANALTADSELRKRYQIWSFIYGSGNPLVQSIAEFRAALTRKVQELDPQGTNRALQQMVIIGHSQGGLLTKSTAVDVGDRLWKVVSTNKFEQMEMPKEQRERLQSYLFLKPLPFVKRVVFIATPHRGSYLSSSFARSLAARFVSLPANLANRSKTMIKATQGSEAGKFLQGRMPTSLDGMSPKNPGLLVMAEIPVDPSIKAHSIIPVLDKRKLPDKAKDGVVAYKSAHVDYVESEYILQSYHSCLDAPATVEEVRRILREHLASAER